MNIEELKAGLRTRALKKRKHLADARLGLVDTTPRPLHQVGELGFKVLERDADGAVKIFAVRTPNGNEVTFEVTERDAAGQIKSFKVES